MLKSLKVSFILSSVLYILLGVTLLTWPTISLQIVCYAFGGITLFYGLVRFVSYLGNRDNASVLQGDLFFGILMMGIGAFLLIKPGIILSILPIVLGLFIIFNSLIKLQHAFELKTAFYEKWWVLLFLGIATAGLGVVIIMNPFETIEMSVMAIGVILILDGASNIFTIVFASFILRRLKRAAADMILASTGAKPAEPAEIYEESTVVSSSPAKPWPASSASPDCAEAEPVYWEAAKEAQEQASDPQKDEEGRGAESDLL